jgi:aryl carrier-like protein
MAAESIHSKLARASAALSEAQSLLVEATKEFRDEALVEAGLSVSIQLMDAQEALRVLRNRPLS